MFRRTMNGQASEEVTIKTVNVVVSVKIQVKIGLLGQKYSVGTWLEPLAVRFVL